jgi:hypothetical protein
MKCEGIRNDVVAFRPASGGVENANTKRGERHSWNAFTKLRRHITNNTFPCRKIKTVLSLEEEKGGRRRGASRADDINNRINPRLIKSLKPPRIRRAFRGEIKEKHFAPVAISSEGRVSREWPTRQLPC